MSTSMFHCEYCNTSMTGGENYRQHMEGKKHLKKLKSLGIVAISKTVSDSKAEPVAGYDGKFVKPGGDNGNTVTSPPLPKPISPAEILGTSNSDPVMNAIKANMMGKLPLKRAAYDRRCDVCNVDYSSQSHEEQHLSGKKHKKKVQSKALEETHSAVLHCHLCNLQANSVEQMEQHRNGAAHKKKVEKASELQQEQHPSAAKKKFVPSSEPVLMNGQIMPPPKLEPLTFDK